MITRNDEAEAIIRGDANRRRSLLENSQIPQLYLPYKWSGYKENNIDGNETNNETVINSRIKAKILCMEYCHKNNLSKNLENGLSLIIRGQSGSGKTVLGVLVLKTVVEELMVAVKYVSFSQLSLEASTVHLEEEREYFEKNYREPAWLMIDEVDDSNLKSKYKDKIREYIGYILWQRYSDRKPTIITTTILKNEEKRMSEAIGPRGFAVIGRKDAYDNDIEIYGGREGSAVMGIGFPDIKYDLEKIKDAIGNYISTQWKNDQASLEQQRQRAEIEKKTNQFVKVPEVPSKPIVGCVKFEEILTSGKCFK
jgi:DNA replication protein DnaC